MYYKTLLKSFRKININFKMFVNFQKFLKNNIIKLSFISVLKTHIWTLLFKTQKALNKLKKLVQIL